MSEYQNIVIIGASVAGHHLANALAPTIPATHRILVVDANAYSYWAPAALRGAVVPGWEDKLVAPNTTATFFAKNTPHQVIAPNKAVELKENSIVLEKPFEGSTELPFFKCVLATGAVQPAPMRPAVGASLEETKSTLRKLQQDIASSSKIVIIGGGSVGVEMAGEIREKVPDASITIVHSGKHILNPDGPSSSSTSGSYTAPSNPLKLSLAIEKDLETMNIEIVLGDKTAKPDQHTGEQDWDGSFGRQSGIKNVHLESGKVLQADFVFISIGNKPQAGLVEKADGAAIKDGFVWVDEYLKVKSDSPSSVLTKNYYAIGDCCNTPGWKTSQGAGYDGDFCATNIVNDIRSKPLKVYKRPVMHGLVLPLGKSHGAGSLTLPYLGTVSLPGFMVKVAKGKSLLIDMAFVGMYKGDEKVPVPTF